VFDCCLSVQSEVFDCRLSVQSEVFDCRLSVQSDATVDSGFGSQPMEEVVEEPPVANQ